MNCNNSSTRRLALLSAGVSLFGAVAAFGAGPGGSITISSSPALQLGASGLTQGLVGTVWHTGSGTYAMPPGANGRGTYGNLPDVSDVETFINSGSYNSPTTGGIYTLPAPAETFLNTADTFNYNGGGVPASGFLGKDSAGAALYDGNPWNNSIVDQMGYIKIASAGTYTFTLTQADDASAVYIGGTGITPTGNAGTGTQVVALGYDSNYPTGDPVGSNHPPVYPASDGTAAVTFSSAGYYPIEIMNYQQGGGANLSFSVTAPTGGTTPTFWTTSSLASGVTPAPTATASPVAPPSPTDEWNFAKSAISGSTVSDIGTAGSASTAGTIVGTGNTISGGALVATNSNSGNGMSVPDATFANYTGSFTVSVTLNRSTSDPAQWSSFLSFGTQSNGLLMQPQRQDGTNWSSAVIPGAELIANNQQPTPAGKLTQEVLVYDATTHTVSLYINGALQMTANDTLPTGSLAAIADPSGGVTNGLGGLDPYNNSTMLGSYYDLSTWNAALTPGQVSGLYTSAVPAVPEPTALALLALGAMGMMLVSRRRKARC